MEADASLWVAEDMVPHSQERRRNVSRNSVDQESRGRGTLREEELVLSPPPAALSWEAGGTILAGASCDLLKEKWRRQDMIRSGLNLGIEDPLERYKFSYF